MCFPWHGYTSFVSGADMGFTIRLGPLFGNLRACRRGPEHQLLQGFRWCRRDLCIMPAAGHRLAPLPERKSDVCGTLRAFSDKDLTFVTRPD